MRTPTTSGSVISKSRLRSSLSARVGGGGSLTLGQDGKTVYVGTSSGLNKLDGGQLKAITFAAEFESSSRS